MSYHGTRLFKSLMEEFIAAGRTVFAEQSLAKARSSRLQSGFRPAHCTSRIACS